MNRFLYFFLSIMLFQQTYSQSNNYYTVIESIEDVEVRQYKKMIYASYTPIDQPDRGNSFKNVAGYIFGSNDKNQNIKMTSPVVVKLHNDNEMAFIMPDKYQINNLPIPNNDKIQIYEEPKSIKAAIRYGGYSNEKIEKNKISELKRILLNNEITHHNNRYKVSSVGVHFGNDPTFGHHQHYGTGATITYDMMKGLEYVILECIR